MPCKHCATLSECELSHVPSGPFVQSPGTTDWLTVTFGASNWKRPATMTAASRLAIRRGPRKSLIHTAALLSSSPGLISHIRTEMFFFFCWSFILNLLQLLHSSRDREPTQQHSSIKCVQRSKTQIHTDLLANHMTWNPSVAFWHQAKKQEGRERLFTASEKTSLGNYDSFLTSLMMLLSNCLALPLSCSFAWTFFWATFVAFSLLASGFNFVHFETYSFLSHLIFLAASVLLWPAVWTYPSLCLRSCTVATSSALVLPYYLSEYKHVAAAF